MEYQASSATISKKLSSGHSFSSKSIYDGVFSTPSSKFGAPNISSRIQDYSEIFGEASRACSIPILDIPALNERNVSADDADVDAARSSKLDYSNVFGGFEEFDYAVSFEELISESKKKKKKNSSSQKARRTPAERGPPLKVEDNLDYREKNQMNSHEASYQSFDSVKKYNMSYNKVNQGGKNGTNVTTHIAQLHAVPGYTHLIEESTPLQMADGNKPVTSAVNDVYLNKKVSDGITEGMHSRKVVTDLPASGAGKQKSRGVVALQNKSDRRRSNSIDMHEYHHGAHSVKVSRFSGPLPNLCDMHLIDESTPLQKTDSNKPVTSAVNDVYLNKNFSDKITEGIHSTKVVTDLPASGASKQKARGGVALQNDSDRHRSNSIDMMFGANEYGHGKKVSKFSGPLPNSCDTRLIDESSTLQMNDSNKAATSAENDVYLNKNFSDRTTEGIHSTKVVTDLPASSASKQKSRGGAALQNNSDRRRSNSIDMLFGVNEYVHGAHSLKVSPFSGPLPNSCDPRLIDERSPLQMNDSNKPVTSVVNDVSLNKNFSDSITEGIHSAKVVTDLPASGASKQRSRGGAALQNNSNRSRSNSIDMLFSASEYGHRAHSSKVSPSSSTLPDSCDSKGASKRPMASQFGFSRTDFESAGHVSSPPCFDEEVDVNSVAAASVAALEKAIEEAQARMKIAKESMARKKEGFQSHVKLSSNDGLKAEQRREGKIADKANRSKKKDLYKKEDAPGQDSAGMRKQNLERPGHVTPDLRVREKAFGSEAAVGETCERELKPTQADHMQEAAEVWDAEEQFYDFETVVKHKETMLEFEQADKTKKECFQKPEECSQRANTFEEACKQEKIEQKVIAVDLEENEKRLRVVQEQNKSEKKVEVSHEQEKWEETLTYFYEPMNYVETIETQELEKNDNVKRQIEGQEWVQNVKKVEASHEQEMFEETLTDFQEPMNYVENIETQEFEENENMKRQIEAQEWVENVKKVKACHEQETFEEKLGDLQEPINFAKNIKTQKFEENEIMKRQIEAQELLEIEKKGQVVCEEEDIEKENIETQEFDDNENMKRQIESQEYIETEKDAKEAFEEKDIEKEPEDAHKREDTEEACELEIGKEQKDALREEETEKFIDEQSITKIRFNDFPNEEETRNSLQDSDELEENEKLQEAGENEELFKGDTDQIEEKVERQNEIYKWIEEKRLKVAQETLNYEEINLEATDNKCKQDGSENLSKSQEASRLIENDGGVELILEVPAQEENGSTIEVNKAFLKQEENGGQKEAVKDEKVVKEAEQALHQEKSLEATDGGCEQDESENKSKDQEVSRHIENEQAVKDERVVKEAELALHYEKNVEATVDGCKQDERENLRKNQEASRHIDNNKDAELNPEVPVHEENRSTVEANTASFEYKENGKEIEVVKEENDIEDKEILETDGFPQDAFIHSEMKQQMEDTIETIVFYLNGVDFVKTDMSFGQKQHDQNVEEQKIVCNLGRNIEEMDPELGEINENVEEVEFSADQEEVVNISTSSHEDRWDDDENKLNQTEQPSLIEGEGKGKETTEEIKITQITNKREQNHQSTLTMEEKESNDTLQKEVELEKEHLKKIDEAKEREKEREREKMAVERAIREARERAFAEARERAEKAAAEKAAAETRRRVMAEAREKLGKTSAEVNEKSAAEKAAMEAKLKAERAAVERATLEARERALEKAMSEKAAFKARNQAEKFVGEKLSGASRDKGMRQSFSANDLQQKYSCPTSNSKYPNSSSHGGGSYSSHSTEGCDGSNGESNSESVQRCRARSERHQRIVERAAKALAEKNMRDLLAQKEQAERNRLAEALDADVKRWSNGKEGNLRALLSTLQYILGPDSSWQPIPLTDIITTSAVKKAYRKATLFVHPDKLQQRGASIQQKYTCEKVFDLLKEAWNRFNVEER
ncbi:hypothetical protein CMV_006603 [Castanea mollissima]|uniref:J domain-containing protein n=1 Tax=Castanea mollissima TaxID=60419 RepID=A0A8J4VTG0_9ROSI|nr:hypothetical protein CMV_006603 [Castanea mollissima]